MGGTILVVEDDPDIRRAVAVFLEAEGYRVLEAANGLQAIDSVRQGARPALVLVDCTMPVLDARGYSRERAKDPLLAAIPFLLLSADAEADRIAVEIGARAVVPKPISFDALLAAVRSASR